MKRMIVCLCAAVTFGIFFARMSHADDLADLKAMQMAMQKQMKAMEEKIKELERKEKSRLADETPTNHETLTA